MSFIENLQILLERKDIEVSSDIYSISNKIIDFLKSNKKALKYYKDRFHQENEGYYLKFTNFDKDTKYTDLFVGFMYKDLENYKNTKKLNVSNKAALRKITKDNVTQYIIEFYILDKDDKNTFNTIFNVIGTPSWNSSLYHEFTHYLDQKRQTVGYSDNNKRKELKLDDNDINTIADSLKKYYNLSDEINAHFHQSAVAFMKTAREKSNNKIDLLTISFENFKEAFIHYYSKQAFDDLTEQNKKRILKRIYLFYNDLQEYIRKNK